MSGWPTATLGEIAQPKQWPTLSMSEMATTGFPVYGANGRIGYTVQFTHERPTILIGCRGSCGTVHITEPQSYANGNAMALDALDESRVDIHFLAHFLAQRGFRDVTTGTSQPQIIRQNLVRVLVPLPPLPEQRRIAEILDKADALRAKRRAALAQLDILTQSIFLDMFGDPATNPKGWPVDALRNIADTTSGGTPKRDVDAYFGGPIPWVKSGELHQAVVSATEESLTERGLTESSAKLMPPGTLLVAMYGATVGAVAILGVEAATNQAICCISPSQAVTSEYLAHLLRRMAPSLLAKRVGGAQPNLSQELLRNLRIPVPPREVQLGFGERIAAVAQLARDLEASAKRNDALFTSIQHRAFRGEL